MNRFILLLHLWLCVEVGLCFKLLPLSGLVVSLVGKRLTVPKYMDTSHGLRLQSLLKLTRVSAPVCFSQTCRKNQHLVLPISAHSSKHVTAAEKTQNHTSQYLKINRQDETSRNWEVSLDCSGLDLEALTDLILESCPDVQSVSAELVTEQALPGRFAENSNVSAWEEQVQGTSNWVTALLRISTAAAFQIAELQALLREAIPDTPFAVTEADRLEGDCLSGEDWILRVQQGWPPQRIGLLTVYFPWHDRANASTVVLSKCARGECQLVLEGGAAFGTGDHATTRLCVRWLSNTLQQNGDDRIDTAATSSAERRCREEEEEEEEMGGCSAAGPSVLDYGCGSAILALAALRFGASHASGVDVDADSLSSARRNCQLNNLQVDLFLADDAPSKSTTNNHDTGIYTHTHTSLETGSEERDLRGGRRFHLTVANILAPVLIQLAPRLAGYTHRGGRIALSGVLQFQAAAVMDAYRPYFDDLRVAGEEDGWVLIEGTRC